MNPPSRRDRPAVRCAIYTRKSTEEGLDQAFNSLHAQREACEAYVLSQAGEGWAALPTLYDDGGFSGGNIERPALKRLLEDIDSGHVDIVVVYKIDRLTRSLGDFAKIVERLDAADASFVSVTQAFNTTTSMGRLTLNVLLSFAQFEREVTGERIRDKIAASKAKGMWMGGNLPLGYDTPTDAQTRALVVNELEAESVRTIFRRYLDLGSVSRLQQALLVAGVKPKVMISRKGNRRGAGEFSRGALFHLLKNRVYLGEITHRGAAHAGRHRAIVDQATFDAVQSRLAEQAVKHCERPMKVAAALLRGRIFDALGRPMTPTFAQGRGGAPYRYYVSVDRLQGRGAPADMLGRVSAPIIEDHLRSVVRRLVNTPDLEWSAAAKMIDRVEVHSTMLIVTFQARTASHGGMETRLRPGEILERTDEGPTLTTLVKLRTRGGRIWLVDPDGRTPVARKVNPALVRALKAAQAVLRQAKLQPELPTGALTAATSPGNPYDRKLCMLGFLAPEIQKAILDGRQPRGLTLEQLMSEDLPLGWGAQKRVLGFA